MVDAALQSHKLPRSSPDDIVSGDRQLRIIREADRSKANWAAFGPNS